jgi:branched-chain amino acid transport system substrate-binding protein
VRRIARPALGIAVAPLLAVGCSAGDGPDIGLPAAANPPATTAPATTEAEVESPSTLASRATSTTGGPATTADADDVALAYVGAEDSGVAASSGPAVQPVVLGYVNEEGGTRSFPEATLGAQAAVDYVNTVLGGVQGRPLELRPCAVVTAGDGERCAARLAADPDVNVVLAGVISREGLGGPLLAGLRGRKPVVLANPLTTGEFVADDAYAFTPGAPGVIQGMSVFAARYLPAGRPTLILVAHADTAPGRAAYTGLARPALDALGVPSVGVPVREGASAEQVAATIAQAGATATTAVVVLTPLAGCVAVSGALRQVALDVPVVASQLCRGRAMADHAAALGTPGEVPDGWYFGGTGFSYSIPGNPEIDAYMSTITDYAQEHGLAGLDPAGFAGPTYGSVLAIVRLMNGMPGGVTTPAQAREAIRSFRGPMWGVVGPMACGLNTSFPALCGVQVGIQRYVDGQWVSVRDGANGRPIDPRQELVP